MKIEDAFLEHFWGINQMLHKKWKMKHLMCRSFFSDILGHSNKIKIKETWVF